MPTADRPGFATEAIASFQRQTWANKELVIVDDGREALDIDASGPIRYFRFPPLGMTVGLKRNIACELARGKYIIHWDDDDTYSDDRIEHQMLHMLSEQAQSRAIAVTGYRSMIFQTPEGRRMRYKGTPYNPVGVSMLYEKAYWLTHPFNCVRVGEDTTFGFISSQGRRLALLDGDERIIARAHPGNTSPKTDEVFAKHPATWEEVK